MSVILLLEARVSVSFRRLSKRKPIAEPAQIETDLAIPISQTSWKK